MTKPAAAKSRRKKPPSTRRAGDTLPDFRDLVENAVRGILVHRNFKPLYANRAFAALFGYRSAKDILALPLLRPLIPPDRWAQVEKNMTTLSADGKNPALRGCAA